MYYGFDVGGSNIIKNYYVDEPKAMARVDRFINVLAACLGNLLTIFDPHLIVIGGGQSNFNHPYQLLPPLLPSCLLRVARLLRIEKAHHGDASGVRGDA